MLKKPYNQGQYKDHLASVSDQERQVLRAIMGQKTWQILSCVGMTQYDIVMCWHDSV